MYMPLIFFKVDPKPGDLIEFLGVGYDHWGVYVGDGYVVHLTADDGESSLSWGSGSSGYFSGSRKRAVVKKQTLEEVAEGRKYRVNNKYDYKRKPRSPEEIVEEAEKEVGKKKHYDLTKAKCEHFATELRYRRKYCKQIADARRSAVGGALQGVGVGIMAFVGGVTLGPAVVFGAAIGAAVGGTYYLAHRQAR